MEVFLKPKTLVEYLVLAHQNKWTGKIDVNIFNIYEQKWSIYFHSGELIWCSGGKHERRRWRRLMYQYCPHISLKDISWERCANYYQLKRWVEQGLLMSVQAKALIQNNFAEVLFDILQQESNVEPIFTPDTANQLTAILPAIDFHSALNYSQENWKQWCEAGLRLMPPNCVPVLNSQQKSLLDSVNVKLYRQIVAVIDGDKSLRDIALLLRQPLLSVALSLYTHFHQGALKFYEILDLDLTNTTPLSPNFNFCLESLLSNSGRVCSNCGYDNNSITASLCQRCNCSLVAKALPMQQSNSLPKWLLVILLLFFVGFGYFAWHNLSLNLAPASWTPLKSEKSVSDCDN